MVDQYAAITHLALERVLTGMGSLDYEISMRRVRDLTFYFLRDLLRIGDHQNDAISGTKFSGYWAFWIRKVKPILFAYDRTAAGERELSEVTEINERVALDLALSFVAEQGKGGADFLHDQVRSICPKECDGAGCLEGYLKRFVAQSGGAMLEYVTYSMAYRTFGPHHMTMFLDQLVFGSCQAFALHSPSIAPEA